MLVWVNFESGKKDKKNFFFEKDILKKVLTI